MRPAIILAVIDSLRADVLEGHDRSSIWDPIGRPRTPSLDALAAVSTRFSEAWSCSSWTRPSVPSLLLGLHPSQHGIFEVEKTAAGGAATMRLPDELPTLAEILQFEGWRTIGLAPNAQLDPALGFGRGFDRFSIDSMRGTAIVDRFDEFAREASPKPIFAYLHFLEPHWPYGRNIARRADGLMRGGRPFHRFRGDDWKSLKEALKHGETTLDAGDIEFMRRLYALAVEEADAAVGRLMDRLGERRLLDSAIVLLTADHGEELMDHGSIGHGHGLYQELVHVPLWIRWPDGTTGAPRLVDRPVSHIDLVPTLLAGAGIGGAAHAAGRSLIGDRGGAGDAVFAEVKHKRRYRRAIRKRDLKLIQTFIFERRAPESVESGDDYNNLEELLATRPFRIERELYDLATDPMEARDLGASHPEVVVSLEQELEAWWRELVRYRPGQRKQLDDEVVVRLRGLGYL